MIEHKKSSDSLKMHQFITFCICKIFAKDFENTKYLEILSEYHSAPTIFSEDIYRMSEKDFENFFKNKSLL